MDDRTTEPPLASPEMRAIAEVASHAVERHLARVAAKLPAQASDLIPATDESDAVILHLWQALQIVIDLATTACIQFHLGTPERYADAFHRLSSAGLLDGDLALRLANAADFCNVLVHAYDKLDLTRIHAIATHGSDDLRTFLRVLRDILEAGS
jgi:uncharacterized protein YutE (UPF0331/DUF86 family)